jgi:hypothetical protein
VIAPIEKRGNTVTVRNWRDEISDLAYDLFNIEVNTIRAGGITGRKMPSWPHALVDIADGYRSFLGPELGVQLADFWNEEHETTVQAILGTGSPAELDEALKEIGDDLDRVEAAPWDRAGGIDPERIRTDELTFTRLRYAAKRTLFAAAPARPEDRPRFALDDYQREVLIRIRRNCDQLKTVLRQLREDRGCLAFIGLSRQGVIGQGVAPRAPSEHAVRIRKIWDIGTDEIVLQTVLQLDGDVINRIKRNFDLARQEKLWEAHRRSVDLGVAHWQTMFELLQRLISGAFRTLLGRPS